MRQKRQDLRQRFAGKACTSCGGGGAGMVLHILDPDDAAGTVRMLCPPCHGGSGLIRCGWRDRCATLTRKLLG